MLILNSINTAFIHIPKSGGTSVSDAVKQCLPDTWFQYEDIGVHGSLQRLLRFDLGRFINNYIVQVRNPYERFISAYYHQKPEHGFSFQQMLEFLENNLEGFPDNKLLVPQHQYIKISPDFERRYSKEFTVRVFKLEDQSIWQYLRDNGYPVFARHTRKTQNKSIVLNRLKDTQRETIYNYYRKDFGKFGYNE